MAVHKASPAKLKQEKKAFVVLPSEAIAKLPNPDALAILVYLLDKPSDWIVRRADIMERFNIGRDRYDRAMKQLSAAGFCWREDFRGEGGRYRERLLHISAEPTGIEYQRTENRPEESACGRKTYQRKAPADGKPTGRKTHRKENPPGGKTDHLHKTEFFKQNRSSTQQRTRDRSIQEDLTDTSWAD